MVNHYLAIAFVAIGLAHQDARAWGSLLTHAARIVNLR